MHRLNASTVRFVLVGAVNTATDLCIYLLLRELGLAIFWANLFSTTVALSVSFALNRSYTFKASGDKLRAQIVRFLPVTLIGLWVIQPLLIYALTPTIDRLLSSSALFDHTKLLIPKLAATVVTLIWNYFWYKHYVFLTREGNK